MITISLCMIVKNEERVLRRCLNSIADLMDEIIIVDTGSNDRTKEIAAEFTDQIYDYTWKQDFAAARNFSFSKANMEYIYVADADEVLDEENRKKFLQLKQVLLPEIDIVQMYYCNQLQFNTTYNFDKEYRPKLYKRIRTFEWVDPIHESVRIEPIIYDSEISILHLPENNHGPRDFSLFQNMFKKGQEISKKLHKMYARELFIAGEQKDFLQAKDFFLQTIKDGNRSLDEIKEAALVLARIYRYEGNVLKFFQYVMKDIVTGASSEGCYELGCFYMQRDEYEEACNWFQSAIEGAEANLNIRYQKELPVKQLKICYGKLEEIAKEAEQKELAEEYRKAVALLEDKEE